MSTAAVELQEHEDAAFFALSVVRRDSMLAGMLAERADHYGEHIKHFARYAEEHGGVVEYDLVRDYFRDLNADLCAANTKRIRRQAVKARLRVALDGMMDFNKAAAFREALAKLDRDSETKAPKVQPAAVGQDKVIRRDEYDRLITAASYRDRLLLDFLWTTGCRVSELTGILLARCEVKGKTVHVPVTGKGNKERVLRIRLSLFDAICAEFKGTVFLFETSGGRPFSRVYVSGRVHKLAFEVLGRKLGAHSLRHSFATRQIRRTNKIAAVSSYLGHSSTSITMNFYVHEQLDDDELFDPEDGE